MDIKDIVVRVNKLDNKEKLHILNLLKTDSVDFTKNANGYFFNLTNVDEDIISRVYKTLELIETNRDLIRKIDKRREELLVYYKKMISDKIETKIKKKVEEYNNKLLLHDIQTAIDFTFDKPLRYMKNEKDDPDDLIKEYNKSLLRYEKNNVYSSIISKIKAYNSNNNSKNNDKKKEKNNNYDHISDYNDDEYDMVDVEDEVYNNDVDDEMNELLNDDDDVVDDEEVEQDNTYYSDDEMYENNENEEEDDDKNDKNDSIKNDESEMETNMNYYKNLLNKKGFSFDDNRKCFLGYQEYIV